MQNEPFIIETIYNTSVENVWKAITNNKEMRQWYFDVPGFRPEPGYEFQFISEPEDERPYRHLCQIVETIPFKKLAFTWHYNRYEAVTRVIFELLREPDGKTRFILTHEGLDSYPDSDPDFSRESFAEGWTWIARTALKEYVEKTYRQVPQKVKMEV